MQSEVCEKQEIRRFEPRIPAYLLRGRGLEGRITANYLRHRGFEPRISAYLRRGRASELQMHAYLLRNRGLDGRIPAK